MNGSKPLSVITVFCNTEPVGTLAFNEPGKCAFVYDKNWIKHRFEISPCIPFDGQFENETITRFLRNLFPEGAAFDLLLESQGLSQRNLYAILKTIGNDTAGILTFFEADYQAKPTQLRNIAAQELIAKLDTGIIGELVTWDGKYRLSVAGVQSKLNVYIDEKNQLMLADGEFSSTHILKFSSTKYPSIVINELLCMRLAKAIGLDVANVTFSHFGQYDTLIVERFDRKRTHNGVKKRHIIDACQALDLPPEYKYEHSFGSGRDVKHIRDGASFKKLFTFAKKCKIPAATIQSLLDWLIFNLLIGNSDAHGKNVSFFVTHNGLSITPFYDLVSVLFEANKNNKIDTSAAMAIGDNFDFNTITAFDLLSLADESNIAFSLLKTRVTRMLKAVLKHIHTLDLTDCELTNAQLSTITNLKHLIVQRANDLLEQSSQLSNVAKSLRH